MRLTRQSNYAVRALIYCAVNDPQLSRIADIARAHGISEMFLFKLIKPLVENGLLRAPGDQSVSFDTDEFLSPLLDILPAQIYTEALAKERGWASFRYIRKVVTDL